MTEDPHRSPYGPAASPYVTPSSPYEVSPYDPAPYTDYTVPAAAPAAAPAPADDPPPAPPPPPGNPGSPGSLGCPGSLGDLGPDRPRGEGRRISQPSGVRRFVRAAVLPALGTLLLAWAMTTLVGDVRWGPFSVVPVAFASVSPLIVVAALPVIVIAIQRRRWAALVPAAVAAGLPWIFVIGYALPADPPAGTTVPLRAMIVTAHDGTADAADIVTAVRAQRPDLLVVTELSAQLAHDLAVAGLPDGLAARYVSVPEAGTSPAAGIGVYSRFTVDGVRPLPGTHWPAVTARVLVGRTPVTLVAGHAVQPSTTHLDRWRRDLSAFRAAELLKGPVLELVNLNATPWNAQFRWMVSGRLHDAADVLGRGLRPTWPAWSPLPLLATDHALVAGLGVSELSALPVAGSDHRALSVGLVVPVS